MFQISFIIQQTNFQPLQTTLKFIYLSGNRPGGDYNFVGAVSYGTSGLVPSFGTIQIFADRYACVGSGCGTQICVTHDQCTAFSGIVSGVNCFACGATQVFSPTTSNCVCKPTFTQTPDGNCIQCPLNAHYNTVTKTCECDTDFTLNAANQCISHDCPYLQSWSTDLGRCQCIVKFMTLSGGNCICPDGQTYNSVTQNCVCKPGYIISSTQASGQLNCVQCPELSLPDSTLTTCQCIDAYYKRRSGDPCIRIPNCGPLALWSPTTFTCTCTISYMIQDATGVCQCPTNQVYSSDTKSCRCQPGSYISV